MEKESIFAFHDALLEEDAYWRKHDIAWKFGTEVEFFLLPCEEVITYPKVYDRCGDTRIARYAKTPEVKAKRDALKDMLIAHYEAQMDQVTPPETAVLHDKITALEAFTLTDLILCKLYEIDLHDIIEYRFGPRKWGKGYYDNDRIAEIRLKPCDAGELGERYTQVREAIDRACEEYGLYREIAPYHLNASANRKSDGVNLTDAEQHTEEALPFLRKATEGILALMSDCAGLIDPCNGNERFDFLLSAGAGRDSVMRVFKIVLSIVLKMRKRYLLILSAQLI
jgi:hypothetical protein